MINEEPISLKRNLYDGLCGVTYISRKELARAEAHNKKIMITWKGYLTRYSSPVPNVQIPEL